MKRITWIAVVCLVATCNANRLSAQQLNIAAALTNPPTAATSDAGSSASTPLSLTPPTTGSGGSAPKPDCATLCFASLGAGAVVGSKNWADYNINSNTLQATHIGASTPQYSVGLAYKLGLHKYIFHAPEDCSANTSSQCNPYKAFVSLKFSPNASQTLNGFTYGMTHAVNKFLDAMFGVSYSANNEISPGFQQAAINTVKTQQAAGNPNYAQFSVAALQANGTTAFDGFPTQLINSNGTVGALIYSGSPTVQHYHTGFFVGISVPIGFNALLSGQSD